MGAAVGIAANLLFPPKVASADAGQAIDGLADSVSRLPTRSAGELTDLVADGGDVAPAARSWLGDARRITHDIPPVGAALLHAEQGRRLNVRAVGTPNVSAGLRQGLEALEHSAITIRGMFRALADATPDGAAWLEGAAVGDVLLGLARFPLVWLSKLAHRVRTAASAAQCPPRARGRGACPPRVPRSPAA